MTLPAPRMPAATAACEQFGGSVVSHARRDHRRCQAVLGDGDEEEVEEIALVGFGSRPVIRRKK